MPQFISNGVAWSNCVGFCLRVRRMVNPRAWHLFFQPCAPSDADCVGFFTDRHRIDEPDALTHVARIHTRRGDLLDWQLDHKLGCEIGRYRSTVRELIEGFAPDRRDARGDRWAIQRYRSGHSYIVAERNPRPLRRTGVHAAPTAWYSDYDTSFTTSDLPTLYPGLYAVRLGRVVFLPLHHSNAPTLDR